MLKKIQPIYRSFTHPLSELISAAEKLLDIPDQALTKSSRGFKKISERCIDHSPINKYRVYADRNIELFQYEKLCKHFSSTRRGKFQI